MGKNWNFDKIIDAYMQKKFFDQLQITKNRPTCGSIPTELAGLIFILEIILLELLYLFIYYTKRFIRYISLKKHQSNSQNL